MACAEQVLSQSERYFGQKTPTGLPLGEELVGKHPTGAKSSADAL